MKTLLKVVLIIAGLGLVAFLAIQLMPVQRTNPPVVTQVQWDSPQTQALFQRACADCHSNETRWPWYAYVAPVSWLVADDVSEGREHFNISDLNGGEERHSGEEVGREIARGRMPLPQYLTMHPEARLADAEKQALIGGLQATLGKTQASQ